MRLVMSCAGEIVVEVWMACAVALAEFGERGVVRELRFGRRLTAI